MPTDRHHLRPAALLLATGLLLAGCGTSDTSGPDSEPTTEPTSPSPDPTTEPTSPSPEPTTTDDADPDELAGTTVTLVTHDSFAVSEDVVARFEADTGMTVEILRGGDAGQVVNQAILTAGNPQGDVLFGIDNTFLTRALDADVFDAYEPGSLDTVDPALVLDDQHRVTPIDFGDVCLNYDRSFFDDADVAPPETLEDLTEPAYEGLLVVENPATSSPGLAFLLATVETFGEDGYLDFWADLRDNGVEVATGWEDAYYGQFSGAGGGEGELPLVVSYASSPPAEVFFAEADLDRAPTGVIPASCFRQIEFAGVLAGTDNRPGARALVDFLLSEEFQADVPLQMFVFPARTDVSLPEVFVEHTVVPDDPITMDPERIGQGRDEWIDAWTDTVLR